MTKPTPFIWSTPEAGLSALETGLEAAKQSGAQSVVILACVENNYPHEPINQLLKNYSLTLCGGLFPKIVNGLEIMSTGAIVIGLPFPMRIHINPMGEQPVTEEGNWIDRCCDKDTPPKSLLIFSNALCANNEDTITELYEHLGDGITAIGGNTGNMEFELTPSIMCNEGLILASVLIAGTDAIFESRFDHGWDIIDGPYLVTDSDRHQLVSLNYESAFQRYKQSIYSLTGIELTDENFNEVSLRFPMGIIDLYGNLTVRSPITTDGNSIEFIGNIPVNATISLLHGKPDRFFNASRSISKRLPAKDAQLLLMFNCINRFLYLEEDFYKELEILSSSNDTIPLIGALSLGEFTNSERGAIQLLNGSTVLSSIELGGAH